MELQLPRGMRDFGPQEKILRDRVITTLKETFEIYGFSPLETPIIERWDVLASKYAGGEEILKETYKLTDQGGRELGLRYDLTTPLARFVGMNLSMKRPFKRYHIGTVYRDGPIKEGRYREFYQCDVDTIGASSVMADAELILIARDVFQKLGFKFEIRVNHRELLNKVAEFAGVNSDLIDSGILSIDKLEKIGAQAVRTEMLEKGISESSVQVWLETLNVSGTNENMLDSIEEKVTSSVGIRHLKDLFDLAKDVTELKFVPSLARGLGYYTGMIFEVFSNDPPFDGSLAAGGRYDELIANFIGSDELETEQKRSLYPSTGISFGLEPICELLKKRDGLTAQTVTKAFVIPIGIPEIGLEIAQKLRAATIPTDLDLSKRGVSANLKHANAYEIPFVVIVGQRELDEGVVTFRDMSTGNEEKLSLEDVIVRLQK